MTPAAPTPELLSSLLSDLDAESPVAAGRIRDFLVRSGGIAFAAAAAPVLDGMPDTRARRFLLSLLSGNGLLLDCLADRRLDIRRAVELARIAAAGDSQADLLLARQLADSASGRHLDDAVLSRLMEVVAAVIETPRAALPLTRLLAHPSPRIRSKAALLIGRATRTGRWAERQLASADPRVRANAVEAMWGGDPDVCGPVFREAVRDPNCRVAGNAIAGLYRLGDPAAIALLVRMFAHPSPEFRATAAWCMGETGDPRFLDLLQPAVRESAGRVRQNVLRAISRIRQNAARIEAAGRLLVEAVPVGSAADGMQCVRAAVAGADVSIPAGLAPTAFSVREGAGIVSDYRVAELAPPDVLVVGFVLPRRVDAGDPLGGIIESAIAGSARYGRRHDCWGCLNYAVEEPMSEPEPDQAAAFSSSPAALLEAAAQPGGRQSLWCTVERLIKAAMSVRGSRHIILIVDPDRPSPRAGTRQIEVLEKAAASRVSIHAVWGSAEAADPVLPGLIRRSGGRWIGVSSIDEIPAACARIALGLLARYEISWRSAAAFGSPARTSVRVHCEFGCGESSSVI